jgi:hypothetical protein
VIQEIYGDDSETTLDESLTSTMAAANPASRAGSKLMEPTH